MMIFLNSWSYYDVRLLGGQRNLIVQISAFVKK